MQAFAIIGMAFGVIGFVFGLVAMAKLSKLEKQLEQAGVLNRLVD